MELENQLCQTFQDLGASVSERTKERDRYRKGIEELKLLAKQKADELQRLDEEMRDLQGKSRSQHGLAEENSVDQLSELEQRLRSTEGNLRYWSDVEKMMRVMLRVKFATKDHNDPAKVTLGFLLDKNDLAKKSIISFDNPTLEQVDSVWDDLRSLYLEYSKSRKNFKDRCLENLSRSDIAEPENGP